MGERQAFDLGFEEEKTGSYLPSERSDSQAGGKCSSTKLGSTGARQDSLAVGWGGSRAREIQAIALSSKGIHAQGLLGGCSEQQVDHVTLMPLMPS